MNESRPPLLRVENLTTTFATERGEVTAVDGLSLHVRPGEILGIVGESGSGKSVTAASIMRLLDERSTAYEGRVLIGDVDVLELPEQRMRAFRGGRIAMIFQDPMTSLNPLATVGNQLVEAIRLHKPFTRRQAKELAIEMLERTGIPSPQERFRSYPHQLSGGQRQRVMIAMALACGPDLLIADEPTTALDVTTQKQILDLIVELRDELGMGTILITHDLGVVASTCDRVAVMYLGQIVEEAPVDELFRTPRHPYTRGLLQAMPAFDVVSTDRLYVIPGQVPPLTSIPSGCRFHERCAFAQEQCRTTRPELESTAAGTAVRCLRWPEVERVAIGAELATGGAAVLEEGR